MIGRLFIWDDELPYTCALIPTHFQIKLMKKTVDIALAAQRVQLGTENNISQRALFVRVHYSDTRYSY